MKTVAKCGAVILSAAAVLGISAAAQEPVPAVSPTPAAFGGREGASRRELAYVKLFEGQRHMWKLQRMQTQAGRANSRQLAKAAFEAAVSLDPTLGEAHTALSQLAVAVQPRDLEEGIRHAEAAVKADPQNLGGHRMLARFLTVKSRLNNGVLDKAIADRARGAWGEVARLDPRNAEAWAFISAFAEARGQTNEQIDALKKWVSAAPPPDVGFYEGTMGGDRLSPESASMKLASALARSGKHVEAASLLTELIADDPENADAIGLLSELVDSLKDEAGTAAVAALQQAVYANPDNISLIDVLARLNNRIGRFDDGVAVLKRSLTTLRKTDVPGASTLAVSLAELYMEKDRYDDATDALELALTIRGIDTGKQVGVVNREFAQYVLERLIHVGKLADRSQSVRSQIERARKTFGPDDLFADRQMIAFLEGQGSRREALTLVRSLRASRVEDVRLLRSEASLLTQLGMVDEGVALIRKKSGTPPSSSVVGGDAAAGTVSIPVPSTDEFSDLLFISNLYSRAGRGKDAIESANKAISVASGSERRQIARTALASALQMSGDTAAAESTLREVLKETPGNPMALNNLGYFLVERGEKLEEAVEMIRKAVKVDPKNPSYLDSLGWGYFKLGDLNEAEKYLTAAARAAGDSATIYEHLGDLYLAKNEPIKAKSALERAARLATESVEVERINSKLKKMRPAK